MTRILIYVVAALAVVGGGAYYLFQRNEVSINVPAQAPAQLQKDEIVIQRKKDDEELQRKRLEGIGSVKKLKPVEIGPTLEQEARSKKQ